MNAKEILKRLASHKIYLYLESGKLKSRSASGAISPELGSLIRNNKTQIMALLAQKSASAGRIKPMVDYAQVPLSFAQKRLWFVSQLDAQNSDYNMPIAFQTEGVVSVAYVEQAMNRVIDRHLVLRTVYQEVQGEPLQCLRSDLKFKLECHDMSHLISADKAQAVAQLVKKVFSQPFDLSNELMIKGSYICTEHATESQVEEGVLLFNMHHIASDGWSMDILTKEFCLYYNALVQQQQVELPPLSIQYHDYAAWQNAQLADNVLEKQVNYWQKQLADAPAVHSIPLDFPRPDVRKGRGAWVSGELSSEVSKNLLKLAKHHQLTPFMLLHGALNIVLARHSGSTDIVLGTPTANRLRAEVEPLIGFFVNTIVLRSDVSDAPLNEYFNRIRDVHLQAQANQDLPFDQLVERLKISRSSHSPLFQIMVSADGDYRAAQTPQAQKVTLCDMTLTPMRPELDQAKFELGVNFSISEQGLSMQWNYDVSLFKASHIEQINRHVESLLEEMAELPVEAATPLSNLSMLSRQEEAHLLVQLNNSPVSYDASLTIHTCFERQVACFGDNIAIVHKNTQLTYTQVNEHANRLAHYLATFISPSQPTFIGIHLARSAQTLIAMLAILKAGGVYVPLDMNYPSERLNYMIKDAQLQCIITAQGLPEDLQNFSGTQVKVGNSLQLDNEWSHFSCENLHSTRAHSSENLAYLIYTSGSTGNPKGVLVPHSGVIRLVKNPNFMTLNEHTVFLQAANTSFDAATLEIWGPLLNGGCCALYPQKVVEPEYVNQAIDDHQVTALWLTSGLFTEWSRYDALLPSLQYVLAGGDVLQPEAVSRAQKNHSQVQVINGYGPTENTTFSTCYPVPREGCSGDIPIGTAISGDQVFILGPSQELLPKGCVGELYVGGDGLAKGYLNLPKMSAERFVKNPFLGKLARTSSHLYRSGDLVKYDQQGNLQYVGRADDQVKIRGFRIEPGEIESEITELSRVDSSVVLVKTLSAHKQLVAYVKFKDSVLGGVDELIAFVKAELVDKLPSYMQPNHWVVIDHWPINPNGKVDKKSLPEPTYSTNKEVILPTTQLEQSLLGIFAELLHLKPSSICMTDNFFELGGHSLLAVRLSSEIRAQLELELKVQTIFDAPSIVEMSKALASSTQLHLYNPLVVMNRSNAAIPVSFSQQRLWFINKLQGKTPEYNMPSAYRVQGELNLQTVQDVLATIIARHEVLRTVYVDHDDFATQKIIPTEQVQFEIEQVDLSDVPHLKQDYLVSQLTKAFMTKAFDLSKDLMLKACYINLAENKGILAFNLHHIAADGWSMQIMKKEFFALYHAYVQGQSSPLTPLTLQYADYAQWQRRELQESGSDKQLEYWQTQLADLPPVHGLSLDYPRSEQRARRGDMYSSYLNADVANSLNELAKEHKLTSFMLLHSAVALVLSRHSNSSDIVVGTPVANRMQTELESLIGYFANTLALRVKTEHQTLEEYLAHVRLTHLDAQSNQDIPFDQLVEKLQVQRSAAYSPVFQIMLTTFTGFGISSEQEEQSFRLPNVQMEAISGDTTQIKFDLNIELGFDESGVQVHWSFDEGLFTAEHIAQLSGHLDNVLVALSKMTNKPQSDLTALSILSDQELHYQLTELNDNAGHYMVNKGIHHLFEAQTAVNSSQTALWVDGLAMSYQTLNERANQVAHYLQAQGAGVEDTLIGLCVERSEDMVVGMLGILKAGAAYVPLDPSLPEQRLQFIAQDASLSLILTQSQLKLDLVNLDAQLVSLNDPSELNFAQYSTDNIAHTQSTFNAKSLAYVIYTSGTSGQPKGVLTCHRAVMAFDSAFTEQLSHCGGIPQSWLWLPSFAFDAATKSLLMLCRGVSTVIVCSSDAKSPDKIAQLVARHDVSIVNSTPQFLSQLVMHPALPPVHLISSGDWLQGQVFEQLYAYKEQHQKALINAYGPTETTVNSSYGVINEQVSHIGHPCKNSQLYILDEAARVLPMGVVGELYISGDGVSNGYLNRPELTKQRFIANPFVSDIGTLMYRTGDLVRYLSDGRIEYVGRCDDQVKVRGYRIELGEIEARIMDIPEVDSALVVVNERQATQELIAYVRAADANTDAGSLVRALPLQLAQNLPDYMVPSGFAVVERWPLTSNGKIDKRALPKVDIRLSQGEFVAPSSLLEQKLARIWSDKLVVPYDSLSVSANFFSIGGHSLLGLTVMNEINQQQLTTESLNVKCLFNYPTIRTLAAFIDRGSEPEQNGSLSVLHSVGNEQPTLYCVPGTLGLSTSFNAISNALEGALNVMAFNHHAVMDSNLAHTSVKQNGCEFAQAILTHHPRDLTVYIAGHSYGGAVALEMCHELERHGFKVSLVLIDTLFNQPASEASQDNALLRAITNNADPQTASRLSELYHQQSRLFSEYRYDTPIQGDVLHVIAQAHKERVFEFTRNSSDITQGKYDTCIATGDHFSMLKDMGALSIAGYIYNLVSQQSELTDVNASNSALSLKA
ncbi:Gramicidin S synthase 2 [Pseudoalteromonas holothuriae]|uniref:Gramicidin S synthase 2 n=1 Tax=Pseudoalteromonas holothuriae TaxID=2963714 RepID=A0ABM9GKK2_9GAMM|nr:non-ribosomal peptide synthetase [Pseudoalteromonas sp. CIP111951]CAH9063379.1 Gramicidin S synthase 2 [Pseudoalteromonas sp. CIP111951]